MLGGAPAHRKAQDPLVFVRQGMAPRIMARDAVGSRKGGEKSMSPSQKQPVLRAGASRLTEQAIGGVRILDWSQGGSWGQCAQKSSAFLLRALAMLTRSLTCWAAFRRWHFLQMRWQRSVNIILPQRRQGLCFLTSLDSFTVILAPPTKGWKNGNDWWTGGVLGWIALGGKGRSGWGRGRASLAPPSYEPGHDINLLRLCQ